MHVHITGASGSGTSTVGKALAAKLGGAFIEADDIFWIPTAPPYQLKRPVEERRTLLLGKLNRHTITVLSGSVDAWGSEVEDAFDYVVFLYLDTSIRIERLHEREMQRFGKANPAFIEWAKQYDEGFQEGRSLARQQAWLSTRKCPVLSLEGDISTEERVTHISQWIMSNLESSP